MKKRCALALGVALAAGLASETSAAQILVNPSQIIGRQGVGNHAAAFDEQAGPVSLSKPGWISSYGATVVLDLGQAYDLGRFDFFSQNAGAFAVRGGNNIYYNGFGSWLLDGKIWLLASGDLQDDLGDAGGRLTAQPFGDRSGGQTFRYLEIALPPASGRADYSLNEFRLFDNASAVPEPATWALMIGGFGLVGAAVRRRRTLALA